MKGFLGIFLATDPERQAAKRLEGSREVTHLQSLTEREKLEECEVKGKYLQEGSPRNMVECAEGGMNILTDSEKDSLSRRTVEEKRRERTECLQINLVQELEELCQNPKSIRMRRERCRTITAVGQVVFIQPRVLLDLRTDTCTENGIHS